MSQYVTYGYSMLQIQYAEPALKNLRQIGRVAAKRVVAKIESYARNPQALSNQVKMLKGSPYLRLRAGDYRVIFTRDGVVMSIIKVGHRAKIYE